MHSYLALGFGVNLIFEFDENESLLDFIWEIKKFNVLSDLNECSE